MSTLLTPYLYDSLNKDQCVGLHCFASKLGYPGGVEPLT